MVNIFILGLTKCGYLVKSILYLKWTSTSESTVSHEVVVVVDDLNATTSVQYDLGTVFGVSNNFLLIPPSNQFNLNFLSCFPLFTLYATRLHLSDVCDFCSLLSAALPFWKSQNQNQSTNKERKKDSGFHHLGFTVTTLMYDGSIYRMTTCRR